MNCEFTIQVLAPDEELDAAGECYAIFSRNLNLDLVPPIGATIALNSNLIPEDQRSSLYGDLINQVDNPTCQFEIDKIVFYIDDDSGSSIKLRAKDLFESSIQKFHNLEKLLTEFYKFNRIV